MNLSATLATMIASFIIPVATALLTKASATTWLKQLITALLSGAAGAIAVSTQADGTAIISKPTILLALGAFITSQATYWGLYRPHAVNATLLPTVGVG